MNESQHGELFQPYGRRLTIGEILDLFKDRPRETPVELGGGGDYDDGHTLEVLQ